MDAPALKTNTLEWLKVLNGPDINRYVRLWCIIKMLSHQTNSSLTGHTYGDDDAFFVLYAAKIV